MMMTMLIMKMKMSEGDDSAFWDRKRRRIHLETGIYRTTLSKMNIMVDCEEYFDYMQCD